MKEYKVQYGSSILDTIVIRPGAVKYLPKKVSLWVQIKLLEYKRNQIVRHALKVFPGSRLTNKEV